MSNILGTHCKIFTSVKFPCGTFLSVVGDEFSLSTLPTTGHYPLHMHNKHRSAGIEMLNKTMH